MKPKPDPLRPAPIHKLTGPVRRFLQIEAMSGVVLLVATIVALALANGGYAQVMHDFWHTKIKLGIGTWDFSKSLEFWINDGLMTVFFFVVGLEIKREIMVGELRSIRKASLPVIAALGGMVVPAGVYLLFGHTGAAQRGWGIPMATDIAFVVGLLAAFGKRIPFGLKIFLLSLAIADDIGAILVIAVAYTEQLNLAMLGVAIGGLLLMVLMNRLGVRNVGAYVIVGAVVWYATYQCGIHPTIAGVAIGLLTPHTPWLQRDALALALDDVAGQMGEQPDELELAPADVAMLREAAREVVSPLQRLEDRLHPWVAFVIMPLFALANAGVVVNVASVGHPVALAVAAGLLLGKVVGIVLFSWLAVKLKLAMLPGGVTWRHIVAGGFLGGIGFTMSLFVSALAFVNSPELLADAKTGVLLGSALSAIAGAVLLALAKPPGEAASVSK
jgi:Na+:H+ antiporter, NhaA family